MKQCDVCKLREENKVYRRLLELLYKSKDAVMKSPLYNLNPSWRTMQAVDAAVNGEDVGEIKELLMRNDLWRASLDDVNVRKEFL